MVLIRALHSATHIAYAFQKVSIKLANVVDNALICMQTVNEKKDSYRFRFQLRQTVISRYTDYAVGSSVI